MSQQDEINATAAQEEGDIASIEASQASFVAAASSLNDKLTALEQQIASNPTQPASALDLTAAQQAATDLHTAAQPLRRTRLRLLLRLLTPRLPPIRQRLQPQLTPAFLLLRSIPTLRYRPRLTFLSTTR